MPQSMQMAERIQKILVYVALIAGATLFMLPIFWAISSSFKPDYQVLEFPPRWIPDPIRWQNYPEALTYIPFGRYTLNTLLIAAIAILGTFSRARWWPMLLRAFAPLARISCSC